MRLLYSNILPLQIEEGKETIVEAINSQMRLADRIDIAVGYVPFVIGKHTGLADYILNKSTVSRFHVRITEEDGQYFLTDLNSTNGTKVNGRLLAANEKVVLSQGDEVWIAEEKYLWR